MSQAETHKAYCMKNSGFQSIVRLLTIFVALQAVAAVPAEKDAYDRDVALATSQAAIGTVIGDFQFTDRQNLAVSLRDFRGKPLVISMIFTSCHHICPMTTKHLDKASRAARNILGEDSFEILTIGFDTDHDTPEALDAFAKEQGVLATGWRFLSGSRETIEALAQDLGFIYFPSPRGFDHLNQLTIIDRDGTVYSQVYGVNFELPWLVEPLKQLVFNRPESSGHLVAGLIDRVRIFCTVYNPASGRYEIDNSLFFQIGIGFIVILSVVAYLWRGFRPARNS